MLESEKLAIAAHLHVLLRRKTGRVTDTEWMSVNAEYAQEIIRIARRSAAEDGHADLAEWAGKLEGALGLGEARSPERRDRAGRASAGPSSGFAHSVPPVDSAPPEELPRYVRGIR
ncbi:MAG: hypothetical protein ING32_02845 [Curvibacter sp.]|jgi:hypothetical protein|nr:hypothetical protein [Curvibacter sp.]